jgi:hypothetical protein
MRRAACILGMLLLPLMVQGTEGKTAPVRREFVPYRVTARLTDHSAQTLKALLAQPPPARRNLVQVNLNRRVRLAFFSTPQWTREVSGRHVACVPILSLQW